ncbi:BrnT family toxin [Patescibacteria group bacterium]|nr:BrnT family toxin [Patescibacteria group bacterium]MBU4016633.1 BrnT family toxin [Patescibacteria group bacterium]MBU4098306.1 BrnT family toxin [Patescibacteria group bacterium]
MAFDLSKIEGFDWNQGNLEHIKKHRVNYRECEEVFLNKPLIVNEDETHSQTEERFRVYGRTNKNGLLFLIFTIRNNKIRVISARNQNKKERKEFLKAGVKIYEKTKTNT